jgi:two-component system chemotaxis response regulator CheY
MDILIVDDEPGTRLMVAAAVERLGHRALHAADGQEGWQRFEQERPDVVITDWAMPGMDGTELARRIRSGAEAPYTFVMILTGQADEGAAREAMRAGADDVLAKPLDAAELERKLIGAERFATMHRRMLEDARADGLTGAGNRLRLLEDLAAICARVERYGHAYCVAMYGVDGDEEALGVVGRALGQAIRSGDMLYRSGPREFVALLPEQALDTASLATERLRRAAEESHPGVSVSAGLVMTGSGENSPEALLAGAEAALARAREGGGGMIGPDAAGEGTLRLLVADDDPVTRLMVSAIVKREPGFELVGEAEDAGGAVELAIRRRPDVVLLDVNMPGGGGARAAVQIREALPDVRIVAISADDSQMNQYDMMRAGAVGFITKGASDEEILRVIRSSARW